MCLYVGAFTTEPQGRLAIVTLIGLAVAVNEGGLVAAAVAAVAPP